MVTPVPEPSGEQFGPYAVYERLGLGGMATVYRAKKRGPAGFERSVALKRMLAHLAEDPAFVESFVREAKVASMLQHPNIAQVYDFGRISGVYYIAMELIAGFDVRKLLRYANRSNEAIPMPVILSILGELCDALDYAHTFHDEAGQPLHIVHRDVSPSNLIIAHTGHLKVIDFGIAKANSRQLHTESGQVKGKLGYMSPEVALGMTVGPVSDIFSLGVVAWELVTASPLFSARTDFETMRKLREEPVVPPSRRNPACPAKLDQLIVAALHRDPDRRLQSAREFRQAIDQIASEMSTLVSARAVADWMLKFAQPTDSWARAKSISGNPMSIPMPVTPPEPPTAVMRMVPVPLRRSSDDIKLATEIWGDDARTVAEAGAQPDFHHVPAATPLPTQAPSIETRALTPAPVPRPTPAPRSNKKPLVALGVLALIAVALGGVLVWKRQSAAPDKAALRFEIEPAGAKVTIAGNEIGHTSPLDTELAPGAYPVRVELDGYTPYTSTITVREGDRQTIRVALDKEDTEIAIDQPAHEPPKVEPLPQEPPVAEAKPVEDTADHSVEDTPAEDKPAEDKKPTQKRDAKRSQRIEKDKRVAEVEPPKVDPPKEELPTLDPPKVDPPKVEPPKPSDTDLEKPARTPVVAATAVSKLSGDVPTLRAKNAEGSGDVLAKLCIDAQGRVSSVKVVKSNPEIADELRTALLSWRYKPYARDGKSIPVCFPVSLRVVVKAN